ncbi:M20 family metallopeptidase [Halorubrum ezzemoulense]|uniref:M20 family metallopeptidase n=1 Tax=Halorubrum ezzemoulense TaxID=337243 RepID=UPI00232E4E91|nr:M20/M25/M40 family metallo-hydrolase [Halorubrum ezzemoulense]MDB2282301.1 M20/M25/M40 family metallo-hydrolase [Halorubrum ezzemoulense]MDB9253168.1 M20/M25/M40 family metallo-hydrolase [Halorubrum ezzemoulense]MDB9256467.1 M20/M25/M40 family metallo-hydrolase [Halorubrum ezzemoulense]MDB9277485.1 M20/M25/M40 family metallo-hydrolase [Halorubrum ezzemoulense]
MAEDTGATRPPTDPDDAPAEYVRAHREELVSLALDLLAVDTSNPPGNTREIVAAIERFLDPFPVEVERFAVDPAKPNLLVRVDGASDRTLLYNGHLDTVPFDADAWTRDPLGERADGRVYGRGATDMKGAVASLLFALRAVVATDAEPPVDLLFAFVSDEEVGGDAGLPALLDARALDANACVIGEPTCEEGRRSVTVADRGSIWLTLEAAGEAAHGSRPMLGVNAVDRLYGAVETIRERFGAERLEIDAEMEPIVEESVEYYAPSMGEATARDLFRYPSINLGVLEGGDAVNAVPGSARAEVDVRLTAGVHTPDVLAAIRDCVADCEGITVADVSWSVGTTEDPASPLVDAVASTAAAVTGDRVFRRSATGGGDAKKLRNAGISTVEFALGTDTLHAPDEYVPVDALVDNAVVYAQLPAAWRSRVD